MRLTLNTDFALRLLMHVGLCGDKLTRINDIAQSFGISKAHLMKVVNDLSKNGYLVATVQIRRVGWRFIIVLEDVRDRLHGMSALGH